MTLKSLQGIDIPRLLQNIAKKYPIRTIQQHMRHANVCWEDTLGIFRVNLKPFVWKSSFKPSHFLSRQFLLQKGATEYDGGSVTRDSISGSLLATQQQA